MLETLIFYENGNYAAFQNHEQIGSEQGNAWLAVLQEKLDRKMIGPETRVLLPGWWTPDHPDKEWTVGELIKIKRLTVKRK